MRVIAVVFILLSTGCSMTVAELRQAPPDHVQNFSVSAEKLSYCVLHAVEERGNTTTLTPHPNHRDFTVTETRIHDAITMQEMAMSELRFITLSEKTTRVELRSGVSIGVRLGMLAWPLVESCAKQST